MEINLIVSPSNFDWPPVSKHSIKRLDVRFYFDISPNYCDFWIIVKGTYEPGTEIELLRKLIFLYSQL